MAKNLLIVGGPGAGKGTQAQFIVEKYGVAHISTGDMFREAIANETPTGLIAKGYISKGALVPDEVTVALVKDRIQQKDCEKGFLLDGFPRTLVQAEALDAMLKELGKKVDKVIEIDVADDVLVSRISGRLICPKCGASFHAVNHKPKKEGICDECGSALTQRKDDTPETAVNRIAVYHNQTEPILGYYAKQGLVLKVDGIGTIDEIFSRIEQGIGA